MGSWNTTCGLTSLPIRYEDEVYVFPVVEQDQSGYRSHCETYSFYKPHIVPFVGVYNDYGQTISSGVSLPLILDGMKQQLIQKINDPDAGRKMGDVIRDFFDIDMMFDSIHHTKLEVSYPYKGLVFLSMFHKPILDNLFIDYQFDSYVGNLVEGGYIRRMNYVKLFNIFMDFIKEYKEDLKTEEVDFFSKIISKDRIKDNPRYVSLGRHLSSNLKNEFYAFHNFFDIDRKIIEMIINDDKNLEEMVRLFCIGCMTNDIMDHTRKVWMANVHEGSQDSDYDIYLRLNNAVDNFIAAKKEQDSDNYWGD